MFPSCGRLVTLFVTLGVLIAPALASDDDSTPLFVMHNGQRVPTVIIPPTAAAEAGVRPAILQYVEADPPPDAEEPATDDEDAEVGLPADDWPDEDGPRGPAARRYAIGQYAGYPVSIPYYPRPGWRYVPYASPKYYGDVLKETYRARRWIRDQERGRVTNARDMQRRRARLLASHEKAVALGLEELKQGNYAEAVIALEMAGELNQGDPACRIHLALARMALGQYEEAGGVLRRALQLQPKLAYVSLNLGSYYAEPDQFDEYVEALMDHVRADRRPVDTWFLVGYVQFQRGNYQEAYTAFRGVASARPDDSLTKKYLDITKPPRN